MFSPWYSWKIAELALNYISLIHYVHGIVYFLTKLYTLFARDRQDIDLFLHLLVYVCYLKSSWLLNLFRILKVALNGYTGQVCSSNFLSRMPKISGVRGRCGRDRMVVWFPITYVCNDFQLPIYAIIAYHH